MNNVFYKVGIVFFCLCIPFFSVNAEQSFTISCKNFQKARIFIDERAVGICTVSKEETNKTFQVETPDKWYKIKLLKQSSTFWDFTRTKDIYVPKNTNRKYDIESFHNMNRVPRKELLDKLTQRKSLFVREDETLLLDKFRGLLWADGDVMKKGKVTIDEAEQFCNNYKYKGYENWRMPSLSELASLVTFYPNELKGSKTLIQLAGKTKPLKYWIQPKTLTFWEKVTFENPTPYFMNFKSGEISSQFSLLEVLCVHDSKNKVSNWLTKETDIVRDTLNQIIWQDQVNVIQKEMTVKDATEYCNSLVIDEIDSWRLPTYSELLSRVDRNIYEVDNEIAIDKAFKSRKTIGDFISSTRIGPDANFMITSVGSFDSYDLNMDRRGYAICVKDI